MKKLSFDDFYDDFINFYGEDDVLPNWTQYYEKIQNFRNKYQKKNYLEPFNSFLCICLDELRNTMMTQIRLKIIQSQWESMDMSESLITDHEIWSFPGSVLNTLHNYYKNYESYNLCLIKHLINPDGATDIKTPERLREEIKNPKKFTIMISQLESLSKKALYALKEGVFKLLKVTSSPNLDMLVKEIINREDLKNEFISLYNNFDFKRNFQDNTPLLFVEPKNRILRVYPKFMNSLCTKGLWSIVRHQEYTKASVAIRQQEKIKNCSKGNNPSPF
eukprot:260187_1